ncbi:MAG TPA: helix-turn-helix domain-containing protein, partial [Archangium sp.]
MSPRPFTDVSADNPRNQEEGGPRAVPRRKPSEAVREELLAALRESGWDLQAAADRLGIH